MNHFSFESYQGLQGFYNNFKYILYKQETPNLIVKIDLFPLFNNIQKRWILKNLIFKESFLKFLINRDSKYYLKSYFILFSFINKFISSGLDVSLFDLKLLNFFCEDHFSILLRNFRATFFSFKNYLLFFHRSFFYLTFLNIFVRNTLRIRGLNFFDFHSNLLFLDENFLLLSWNFNFIFHPLILAFLNSKVIKNHKYNLKQQVKNFFYYSPSFLVLTLNKTIRNWVRLYYYSDRFFFTCRDLDLYLSKILWRFLRNFHSRKSKLWIFNKYWIKKDGLWYFFILDSVLKKSFFLLKHYFIKTDFLFNFFSFLNIFDSLNRFKIKKICLIKLRHEEVNFYLYDYSKNS